VEDYAERLRALHRDLTLVLQAVERGLAAAARPEEVEPPVPEGEPIEIVPEPEEAPAPVAEPAPPARTRMPRVEVLPAPSGEQRRHELGEERRAPAQRFTKEEPAEAAEAGGEPEAPAERGAPRPSPRFPARPSAAPAEYPREPEWVERGGESFTAPTFPAAPAPQRLTISPAVAAAFVAAWLVVVALLVALLVS
jgi:hypothetical protein